MATLHDSTIFSMTKEDIQNYEVLIGQNIVVVIPAYNEERFIGSVVLKVKKFTGTVIVVDDGSTDDTSEIAVDAGAMVVRLPENGGKGAALTVGFKKAAKLIPDVVVTIDGDGQHLPEELPTVVAPILNGEADLVVGSRYLGERSNVPKHRVLGHHFFNWLTGRASGTTVTDSQSGFRAFSPKAVEILSFSSKGFTVESEMQFIANEVGLRVKEVPITIYYKDAAKRSAVRQGLSVLNGVLRLMGQYRPLLFFGLPGLLIMGAGFLWGVWVVDIFRETKELAVGYAMISVLLAVVGMAGFTTGVILHSMRGLLVEYLSKK